jgi:hypothetical protein
MDEASMLTDSRRRCDHALEAGVLLAVDSFDVDRLSSVVVLWSVGALPIRDLIASMLTDLHRQ